MRQKLSIIFFLLLVVCIENGICQYQQIPTLNMVAKDGIASHYVRDIAQDKNGFMWFATMFGLSRYDGNTFTNYSTDPEQLTLNSNTINKVEADTIHNKVWIGNRWSGINVYDCETETFSSFTCKQGDASSLSSDEITDILVTSAGEVWIATLNKGLNRFDPSKETFIRYDRSTFHFLRIGSIRWQRVLMALSTLGMLIKDLLFSRRRVIHSKITLFQVFLIQFLIIRSFQSM